MYCDHILMTIFLLIMEVQHKFLSFLCNTSFFYHFNTYVGRYEYCLHAINTSCTVKHKTLRAEVRERFSPICCAVACCQQLLPINRPLLYSSAIVVKNIKRTVGTLHEDCKVERPRSGCRVILSGELVSLLVTKWMMIACNLHDGEFEQILLDLDDDTLCLDPDETAPSVVRALTTKRQVLATMAAAEGSYGVLQTGWGPCQERTPVYMRHEVTF